MARGNAKPRAPIRGLGARGFTLGDVALAGWTSSATAASAYSVSMCARVHVFRVHVFHDRRRNWADDLNVPEQMC